MAETELVSSRLQGGIWHGLAEIRGADSYQPDFEITHLEQPLPGLEVTEDAERPGRFALKLPVPAEILSDGVQTLVIRDARADARLGAVTLIAGEPAQDDLRAEIDLLRAELDMLKRAFRRHFHETRSAR